MFSALLYLQAQSVKNRLWQRLRRLRNPRYLFGALIGGLYLASVFSRSFFSFGHHASLAPVGIPGQTWEGVAALGLLLAAALIWLVPHGRAALVFSEAEIAFLFPAPIPRRTLIHFKLVRSQTAVLFTVFFLTLLRGWSDGASAALMRAAGYWILFSTINLHIIGSSFARTLLLERGLTPWRRRVFILGSLAAVAGAVVLWTGRNLPFLVIDHPGIVDFALYVKRLTQLPPLSWLLLPFRWIVRPYFAAGDAPGFWWALGPALLVLALHYLWVVRADVAFEEASLAVSQRHAERVTTVRESRGLRARPHRRRRAPFSLSPKGLPAVALLWKNLISAGGLFTTRFALTLLGWAAVVGFSVQAGAGHTNWPGVVGVMALVLGGWSLLLGPQFVRQDFRQDLAAADLLKPYPISGWQMALGELLAPTLILTVFQWVSLVLAVTLLADPHARSVLSDDGEAPPRGRENLTLAISAAIAVGPLNLVSLLVPNAAALLLPAWFAGSLGQIGGGRGIEVMGQRLIFVLGQFLVQVLALVPPALAAFVFYVLIGTPLLPEWLVLPATALVAALVLTGEGFGGLMMLGHWFERYDLSAERPA